MIYFILGPSFAIIPSSFPCICVGRITDRDCGAGVWGCIRYLKLEPSLVEEYVDLLKGMSRFGEAARRLADALNDEAFYSKKGRSR